MGYCSKVRVITTPEGFDRIADIAHMLYTPNEMFLIHTPGEHLGGFYDFLCVKDEYVCFGYDDIKWSECYSEIEKFNKVLKLADDNGVQWQFARVGEEFGDWEEKHSKNFYDDSSDVPSLYPIADISW